MLTFLLLHALKKEDWKKIFSKIQSKGDQL